VSAVKDTSVQSVNTFDLVRVPVGGSLEHFLSVPDRSGLDVSAARAELAPLVAEYLDRGPGVLVLAGLPPDVEHGRRAVLRITELLGEPLPQNREGEVVREVRDRGTAIGEGARARYSDSRFGGNMHTDGAESPLPAPDIFTLFCVRQSAHGGALRLVHVRDLLEEMAARPDLLEVLRQPFHFDRRGDHAPTEPPTVTKPVLFTQRSRPAITYLRSYVERGHEKPGVPPLSSSQRSALDMLDEAADTERIVKSGKLREGELALFDNLSLLHGRTEFQDAPGYPRLLLRSWVRLADGTA
jgi:hypothetical protein